MGTKIRIVLVAACAATVMAGCAHPTRTHTTAAGQPTSGAGSTDTTCTDTLLLAWADNGRTRCVRLGGTVGVSLTAPDGATYPEIGQTGESLRIVVAPFREGSFEFEASSRGTTVVSSPGPDCVTSGATASCPPGPPWSVTVVVR